jgi:hypothetical protein
LVLADVCPQFARPRCQHLEAMAEGHDTPVAEGDWLTVEDVAREWPTSVRTAKRMVARWLSEGWPRVRRAKRASDPRWRLLVERDSFEKYLGGQLTRDPEPEIEAQAA